MATPLLVDRPPLSPEFDFARRLSVIRICLFSVPSFLLSAFLSTEEIPSLANPWFGLFQASNLRFRMELIYVIQFKHFFCSVANFTH